MRGIFVALLCALTSTSFAEDQCPNELVAEKATITCGSSRSGDRLFTCREREEKLRAAGIDYDQLDSIFAVASEEHLLVKAAIERTVQADVPDGATRAMFWEELAARIDRKLGRAVSKSYRSALPASGETVYVFQGMKRFGDKAYLLVIEPDGGVWSGPAEPLEDLGNWVVHRETLARKSP